MPIRLFISLAFLLMLAGCRLTDHSERDDDEVTTDIINIAASGDEAMDPEDLPKMEFVEETIDAGRVTQGTKVERTFEFTNTGGSMLLLTDVRATCGCTVSKNWPKHPLKPGEKGTIDVVFDSEGRKGLQEKTITVIANTTPPTTVLMMRTDVVAPPGDPLKD